MNPNLEILFWSYVQACEPWIWYLKDACAVWVLLLTLFLPYRMNRVLLLMRFWMCAGMATIFYSWGNTSFGPIGDIVFWTGYAAYRTVQIFLHLPALRAEMHKQGPVPESTVFAYLFRQQLPPPRS